TENVSTTPPIFFVRGFHHLPLMRLANKPMDELLVLLLASSRLSATLYAAYIALAPNHRSGSGSQRLAVRSTQGKRASSVSSFKIKSRSVRAARFVPVNPCPTYPPSFPMPVDASNWTAALQSRGTPRMPLQPWT